MDFLGAMDFFTSIDGVICLVTGAIIGLLASQFLKGKGIGLIADIILGAVGAVIGGYVSDVFGLLNIGDYPDPIIAGVVGAAIFLGIARLVWR